MATEQLRCLTRHLLDRVHLIRRERGADGPGPDNPDAHFSDLLDSMGMVEFLLVVATDCGTTPETIEASVGREFGTVAELAAAMHAAGLSERPGAPGQNEPQVTTPLEATPVARPTGCWLGPVALRLPERVQPAAEVNALLHRPPGWLERHAGIEARRVWDGQDALAAAAEAGRDCIDRAGLRVADVGTLLVTSEAPPLLVGLAAALHYRLGLRTGTVALEVGGACTGFLTALWLARTLLSQADVVLMLSVEAPTRYLPLRPGSAGEAAALFGDAAAACVVFAQPCTDSIPVFKIVLGAEGGAGQLIQLTIAADRVLELHLQRQALASHAVRAMAQVVRDLLNDKGLDASNLAAVVAHGGNGRMPALLARQLGLPPERVWSETARTGNLGSASLPVAWAAHKPIADPVIWTAVGAGLTWGAALTGQALP